MARFSFKPLLPLDKTMFVAGLVVFLATRLIGLEKFPIYFFTDEAVNTVNAADFIDNGFRDPEGHLFPTYFQNDQIRSLSVSVYAQVIPYLLFGYSIFVTRATSVLIALSAMIALGLLFKKSFKLRYWWLGVFILSITPAWFLHTRTAFEAVLWVSFYVWFLYFYLQYRQDRPRNIFGALLTGALSFYAYNGGQLGVVLTGLLLALIDWKYHWQVLQRHGRMMLLALLLGVSLTLPYLRFLSQYPLEIATHLRLLGSYWQPNIPLIDKVGRFAQEYLNGLNPFYWYSTVNDHDLIRHIMKGYGNSLWITLPLAVIGLIIFLRKLRAPEYRMILIALVVSPLGGALSDATVVHDLLCVVPTALLTTIGAVKVLSLLEQRSAYHKLAIGAAAILSVFNVMMLQDALINGPTWYTNYGLYGLQFGGKEVFQAMNTYLRQSPHTDFWVFPQTWLNGPYAIRRFFLPEGAPVQFFDLNAVLRQRYDLTPNDRFVLTRDQYQQLESSQLFTDIHVEQTIDLPDGSPGFNFVRLSYAPQADVIFAARRADLQQLISEHFTLDDHSVIIRHSAFDIGRVQDLFDGDPQTLIRTESSNPAVIEIEFPQVRTLTGITLTVGTTDFEITAKLYPDAAAQPATFIQTFKGLTADPTVHIKFEPVPGPIKIMRLEIKNIDDNALGHVHVREIQLNHDQ